MRDYPAVLDAMADAVLICRHKGDVLFINRALADLWGADGRETALAEIAQTGDLSRFVHEEDRAKADDYLRQLLADDPGRRDHCHLRVTLPQRGLRHLKIRMQRIEWDEGMATLLVLNDVTDQRAATTTGENRQGSVLGKALEDLRNAQENSLELNRLLSDILESLGQGIVVTDADLNIISYNRTYLKMMGLPEDILEPGITVPELILYHAKKGDYGPGDPVALRDARMAEIYAKPAPGHSIEDWQRADGEIVEITDRTMPDRSTLSTFRFVTKERHEQEAIYQQAYRDGLTGLPNRRAFDEQLAAVFDRRHEAPFVLAVLDLDNFKAVNDTAGHAIGDAVLKAASEIMAANIRAMDIAVRLGGDEFAIIFSDMTNTNLAQARLEKIVSEINALNEVAGVPVRIGSSAGLALSAAHTSSQEELFKKADEALYAAKAAGKGNVQMAMG